MKSSLLDKMVPRKWKFIIVISFGIIYFLIFWLLTIGYFTPYWIKVNMSDDHYNQKALTNWLPSPYPWNNGSSCNSMGIVTKDCDYVIYNWFMVNDIDSICKLANNNNNNNIIFIY